MDIKVIKGYIQDCIRKMELQEAYDLIVQYKKIFSYDDEVASMEAIVNIYDRNYDEALKCIREGLMINIFNSDLYFTMGNIYELRGRFNNAYLCYENALNLVDNIQSRNVILSTIDNLKINNSISVNKCSIVILTYNNLDYTKVCIGSIRKYNNSDTYEIIIIDNNSTDGTVEWIKEQKDIKYILNSEPKAFPVGCNQGIEIAEKNNDIFILRNDTVIMPNSLLNLRMGLYSESAVGAVGAVNNCVGGSQQILNDKYEEFNSYLSFAIMNNITNENLYNQRGKLDKYNVIIKNTILNEIKDITSNELLMGNSQDNDWSFKIIACGYKLLLCKDSYIHHFEKDNSLNLISNVNKSKLSGSIEDKIKIVSKNIIKKCNYRENEVFYEIYEIMKQLLEIADECIMSIKSYDFTSIFELKKSMIVIIKKIYNKFTYIQSENDNILSVKYLKNIVYSINNIISLLDSNYNKAIMKIEFETKPLIEDMILDFYFHKCIDNSNEREMNEFVDNKFKKIAGNKYITKYEENKIYKYDVTIIVMAYNKLQYTKACIDSLFKYFPNNINYELILCNHGSFDGTKEYFDIINATKQIDFLENGVGWNVLHRITEGKYCITISNDVLVTKNAISNLIKCIESDEKIAWVVPTTPNISNNQTIEGIYSTIEEMYEFSEKNNISDKYKWEQRARLCNPIEIRRNDYFVSKNNKMLAYYHFMSNKEDLKSINSFPDDKISLLLRRNGYKMMLAKDAYCYHFGSVTLKEEISLQNDFYNKGRKEFFNIYGIDPWGTGFTFDAELMNNLEVSENGKTNILGINCGIGSNSLKLKEKIRENAHNDNVILTNITDNKEYENDLKGISNEFYFVENYENIKSFFESKYFKYILFEENYELYDKPIRLVNNLMSLLQSGGSLILKVRDKIIIDKIKLIYTNTKVLDNWIIVQK